jgi:hypothetical protein
LNPSATEAIQNFLNLSFKICSFCASFPADPLDGMKDGIVEVRMGGEGDRRLDTTFVCCVWSGLMACCVAKGLEDGWLEESELEPESDSEDDDSDSDSEDCFPAIFPANSLLGVRTSLSDEDDEDESDSDDEAARLFLFLLRFLAGALAGAGPMTVGYC